MSVVSFNRQFVLAGPNPDGSLAVQDDRQQIAFAYPGIAANAAAITLLNTPQYMKLGSIIVQITPPKLPIWSTSGRPSSPATGQYGFNLTIGKEEVYNGTSWVNRDGT